MKQIMILITAGALFITTQTQAQHFIASFGVERSWGVPDPVYHSIYNTYYGYDVIHAHRIVRNGHLFFNVVLKRNNVFIQLNIGSHGRIYATHYWDHYPLHQHICDYTCGYHPAYYQTFVTTCYAHHHHGHNHVVYKPGVKVVYTNRYPRPRYYRNRTKVVVVNNNHGQERYNSSSSSRRQTQRYEKRPRPANYSSKQTDVRRSRNYESSNYPTSRISSTSRTRRVQSNSNTSRAEKSSSSTNRRSSGASSSRARGN